MWGRRPGRPGGCFVRDGAQPSGGTPGHANVEDQLIVRHVDIVVKGRHTEVADRFREHVAEKLARVERFDAKVIRVDVEVSKEHNPRQSDQRERHRAHDPLARPGGPGRGLVGGLLRRARPRRRQAGRALRQAADRRSAPRVKDTGVGRGRHRAAGRVSTATGGLVPSDRPRAGRGRPSDWTGIEVQGDGPMFVREKTHDAEPMDLDQALYEMELVGHDFFLFVDAESARPERGLPAPRLRLRRHPPRRLMRQDQAEFSGKLAAPTPRQCHDSAHGGVLRAMMSPDPRDEPGAHR